MTPLQFFRFALRALVAHRLRTGLSLLGMAIGVAAVVVLTALGEGARLYVVDQFASIGTNLLIVLPGRTETTGVVPGVVGVPNDLTLEDAEALKRRLSQVRRVAPISMGTETVSHRDLSRQVAVVGAVADFKEVRRLRIAQGQFLPPLEMNRGAPMTVLGSKVAEELFRGENPLGKVVRIGGWRMKVIGVLEPQGVQLGLDLNEIAIVPVATGMAMFDRTSLFRILVEGRPGTDYDVLKKHIVKLMTERHGEEDVTVLTQDALMGSFTQILNALTLAVAAIAAISLAVAGIGIMNVMLVSVSERTAEIGLLKALGAHRRQILAVFLTEAALLSLLGGLLGLAVGWGGVGLLVQLIPALPASPPPWAVAAALGVALATGVVFGVLPARQAVRLDPVAALARS
jgi:putative ABC transport system permease protein